MPMQSHGHATQFWYPVAMAPGARGGHWLCPMLSGIVAGGSGVAQVGVLAYLGRASDERFSMNEPPLPSAHR